MSKFEEEIRKINEKGEMDPDKHDGSYELMRATIDAYAQMENRSNLDFNDLNLIYSMSIGTWKLSVKSKEKYITLSNLPEDLKTVLEEKLDMIWEKAKARKYENEKETPSIGLFGYDSRSSFKKQEENNMSIPNFIDMCVEIRNLSNEEDIFERCSKTLNEKFKIKGMRAAIASEILHCLKPMVFPILNSKGNIDEYFGVKLNKNEKDSISKYIDNCRKIKKIRDDNFKVKNYRIFDIEAGKHGENENTHTGIKYKLVWEYLNEYGGTTHIGKEKVKTGEEKEKSRQETNKARNAKSELKKMAELCKKNFNLNEYEIMDWQNGGNIQKYSWVQLKKNEYIKSPISISIFVEKTESIKPARFRVSLEIKDKKAEKIDWVKYYKHLDKKISNNSSLVYVLGSNNNDENIKELGKNLNKKYIDNAKSSISDENKRNKNKIQICKIIECNDKTTNDDIETEILEGIQELIPYYEHVFGYEFDKNMIFYGPPGTGKTYNTVKYAVAIIEEKSIDKINEEIKNKGYKEILERYNSYKYKEKEEERQIEFITFHQSYGYEEFIEGIKPKIKEDEEEEEAGKIEYTIKHGIFKKFCNNARGKGKPYVFIIDEINRGNISKIFGELITLIEPTKREGATEATEAILPYTNKPFSVPNNVYIIGTMNTADRSIALMDTALRRRFHFIEMMPDSKVLDKIIIKKDEKELDVAKMLNVMNKRIEYLYDREHTIGHAFFTELLTEPTIQKLGNIFQNSIIPLLQEYFYEDYNKIMLVLGDDGKKNDNNSFIKKTEIKQSSIFRSDTSIDDLPEYSYEINKEAFKNIESYIGIIGKENKDKNESEEEEK